MGIASRLAVFEYGHVYLSVCVCQSQVGVLTKRMGGSRWFLARRLFLRPIMHGNKLLKGNSDHYKIKTLFSGTLSQNRTYSQDATARRSSQSVVNLVRQKWKVDALRVTNSTPPPLSVEVDNICYGRRLVYHTERPSLSTAQCA